MNGQSATTGVMLDSNWRCVCAHLRVRVRERVYVYVCMHRIGRLTPSARGYRWVHTEDWASCDPAQLNASAMEQCIVQGFDADTYESAYGTMCMRGGSFVHCTHERNPTLGITVGSDSVTLKYANLNSGTGAPGE